MIVESMSVCLVTRRYPLSILKQFLSNIGNVMSWIISSNCYRFFLLQRQLLLTKYVGDLGQMHTACVNGKVFVSHFYLGNRIRILPRVLFYILLG